MPLLRLSKLCQPHKSLMVELWGTAPQSKTTIPQRIQNHHHFCDKNNYNIYGGNCKFLSYNHKKQWKTDEVFRQGKDSYQGG